MKRFAMIYRVGESVGVVTYHAANLLAAVAMLRAYKPKAEFVSLTG